MIEWKKYPQEYISENQMNLVRIRGEVACNGYFKYFYSVLQLSILKENPLMADQYDKLMGKEFDFVELEETCVAEDE